MAVGDKSFVVMEDEKGTVDGVATLGSDGILSESQRPNGGQIPVSIEDETSISAALSNKATNYGVISGVDLLDWALDQGIGGTFLTDLTVTGLPVQGYFNGLLTVAGQDRGLMIWDQHGNCYSRNTVSGGWDGSAWIKYVTATSPQMQNLTLQSGFTANSNCTFFTTQESVTFLSGGVFGTMPANQDTQIGTLPANAFPSTQYRCAAVTDAGSAYVDIHTDGTVWAHPFSASSQCWFSGLYVAGGNS